MEVEKHRALTGNSGCISRITRQLTRASNVIFPQFSGKCQAVRVMDNAIALLGS